MLYVIAKVNGRYRSLAAVYRAYDNKGERAVQACRNIIALFQEPLNQALLLHELQLAGRLPPEEWEEVGPSEYPNERPAFPFIATCLLLGASVSPETGKGFNATHEPFKMPLINASEGCTILDVTNPAAVRYAFVFVLPPRGRSVWAIRAAFGNTPLTASEYASFNDVMFDYQDCRVGEDDEVVGSMRARSIDTLRAQEATGANRIASPLIGEEALESAWPQLEDGQSWKRRTDLGLAEIVAQSSSAASDPATSPRQPAAHHIETLHKAFEQSYKLFQPGYNEGLDTEAPAPRLPVKQVANILYLGSLDDSSWRERATVYEPKGRGNFRDNAVQYFTFQVGDCPVTAGQTLDVMHSWMVAATAQQELRGESRYEHYSDCRKSQSEGNLVKFFSLAGLVGYGPVMGGDVATLAADLKPSLQARQQNHRVVKPLPGRAFYYAKQSYHSSGDWPTAGLEDIRQGEWTAFLIQQWREVPREIVTTGISLITREHTPLGFKCAFVTRGDDGEIVVADAETFRSTIVPSPAHEALVEADPGEETYGRELVNILGRGDATINGIPVSLMGRPEVLELLGGMEVVKAQEDKLLASSWSEVHQGITLRRARENETVAT